MEELGASRQFGGEQAEDFIHPFLEIVNLFVAMI